MKKSIIHKSCLIALFLTLYCVSAQAKNIEVIPITSSFSVTNQEGTRLHLSPNAARSMTLAICQKHFPIGSQGRINIQNIVDLINQAPFFGININTTEIEHWGDKAFACPPPFDETVYIDIISKIPIGYTCEKLIDFDATGSVFHLVRLPLASSKVWAYGDRRQPGLPADQAVVSLRESNFRAYAADPLGNPGNAPSEGVIAHEMGGHLFHMGHPEDRTEAKYKVLDNLCNFRSSPDGLGLTHDSDRRKTRITGYTRHLLEQLYPPAENF